MKAFIIFTLISATLASEAVVDYNGEQAMVHHQDGDQVLHVVPRTPDGKHHHGTIQDEHGTGEVDILWAPKKFKAQSTYTGDLEDGGSFYKMSSTSYYDENGVEEETVKNVASNLGLAFEDVDEENEDPIFEESE